MELRHLRYFQAVAIERNFTRAAERVGVAQPPLSRQVRELEQELGLELFQRDARPVRLTEAGRLFYEQVTPILANIEQLATVMKQWGNTGQRRFVVGVVGSIMHGLMPEMIRQFRETAPSVEVELVEATTLEQVDALKAGRIDAGLGRVRIDDPAIRRELLFEEALLVALPSSHPLAGSESDLQTAQLAGETLIVYPSQPRPSYADQVLSLLRDHGVVPAKIVEVREVQTALGLVAAQSGVAIVPSSMRHSQPGYIVYRPITDNGAVSPIILSQRVGDATAEARQFRSIGRRLFETASPAAEGD